MPKNFQNSPMVNLPVKLTFMDYIFSSLNIAASNQATEYLRHVEIKIYMYAPHHYDAVLACSSVNHMKG